MYFLVTVSVQDGEYEYWRYVPVEARDEQAAKQKAMESDEEWTMDDYREVSCEGIQEVPHEDYEVLARYL